MDEPDLSPSDRELFLRWLKASPENVAEIVRIAQLDGATRRHRFLTEIAEFAEANGASYDAPRLRAIYSYALEHPIGTDDYRCFWEWLLLAAWSLSTGMGLLHLVWSVGATYGLVLPDDATSLYRRVLLLLLLIAAIVLGWLVGARSLAMRRQRVID